MNDIDINYFKPLLEETLYTEDIKHRNREFSPLGRHSYTGHGLTLPADHGLTILRKVLIK